MQRVINFKQAQMASVLSVIGGALLSESNARQHMSLDVYFRWHIMKYTDEKDISFLIILCTQAKNITKKNLYGKHHTCYNSWAAICQTKILTPD